MDALMRHLTRKDPSGEMISGLMDALAASDKENFVDLDTFNYHALRVAPQSFWIVQLVHVGFHDTNGRASDIEFPGSAPSFQIMICECLTPYYYGRIWTLMGSL